MGVLAPLGASAHPFGESFYSHRTVMRPSAGQLRIEYSAEIPITVIMRRFATQYSGYEEVGESEDAAFKAQIFAELSANLTLLVDGEAATVDWTPVPDVPNGVASERFFVYHLRADLPHQWNEEPTFVLLINDNFPDSAAYYSGWVYSGSGVQVVSTTAETLARDAGAADVSNLASAWSLDPIFRDLEALIAVKTEEPAIDEPALPTTPEEPRNRSFYWWILLIPVPPLIVVLVRKFKTSCN